MHVYLTILLQVQVADQYSLHSSKMPLLLLGRPLVPPLFPLILPVTRLLQNLPQLPAPLLLPASPTTSSPGLNLVVDLSSYPLQQDTSLTPCSPMSPPLLSRHLMVLRPRQPKTTNLVAFTAADTASTRVLLSPSSEPLAFSDAD